MEVLVARSPWARLRGLAFRRELPRDRALAFPRCRSVHTFGMRFTLDVVFLDEQGRPLRIARSVPPGRVVGDRRAAAVVETRAGEGEMILAMANQRKGGGRLASALDPRQPIYRDTYNEYFVFILSATGASVVIPVFLLLVQVATGKWSVGVFVVVSVVLELLIIFGIGRPQMKPHERVGWALLWGGMAAGLGACFYYLVVDPIL
jgi:uncharacterized membrane protein (UPF0127 family)